MTDPNASAGKLTLRDIPRALLGLVLFAGVIGYRLIERLVVGSSRQSGRTLDMLIDALGSQDPDTVRSARYELETHYSPEAADRLLSLIAADDPLRREHAAAILALKREALAVEALVGALSHPTDHRLRMHAINGLVSMADRRAADAFLKILDDEEEDDWPRCMAAEMLASIGDTRAVPILRRIRDSRAGEGDSLIGQSAVEALQSMESRSA